MRIVLCSTTFPTNVYSSEHWLARGLIDLGHSVTVLATDVPMNRSTSWGPENNGGHEEIPATYVQGWKLSKEPLLAWGIDKTIREGRFDFAIVSETWRPTSFMFASALRRNGVPFMVDTERYSYGMGPVRTLIQRFQDRTVARRMLSDSLALTCHSTASRDFHVGIGVPPERVSYLPASTDTRLFLPNPNHRANGTVKILTTGRLESQKGHEVLLEAMTRVDKARLTIKGRGPLANRLKTISIVLGLSHRVTFDESVIAKEEMPAYYGKYDLYVHPSLDEPFGHAVIEAMSCGLPVVGSDVGGLKDSIEDGRNGYRVEAGKEESLAIAIGKLTEDRSLREEFGKESRRIAEEKFDCRVVARKHVEILQGAT